MLRCPAPIGYDKKLGPERKIDPWRPRGRSKETSKDRQKVPGVARKLF